jgi:hypothetical protein
MSETGKALTLEKWLLQNQDNYTGYERAVSAGWYARDAEIDSLKKRLAGLVEKWMESVNRMKQLSSEPHWKNGEFDCYRVLKSCADELAAALGEGEGHE